MKVSSFTIIITKKVIKICINVKPLAIGNMFNYFPSTGLVYSCLREKMLKVNGITYSSLSIATRGGQTQTLIPAKLFEDVGNYWELKAKRAVAYAGVCNNSV